jgi:hypothetical protein
MRKLLACYHSVQNVLSSLLLYKKVNVIICKTIILPVVLYGCETWPLTLREEHRPKILEGRRPLGGQRHRWVDNIKMDLEEIGWGGMDLVGLAQDRVKWRSLVNEVMNLRVP